MKMTDSQQRFLEQLALRIPRLFAAIEQGNIKSEYIIGVRRVGHRHVRLKIVAEVVDACSNPLQTHSSLREAESGTPAYQKDKVESVTPASKRRRPIKRLLRPKDNQPLRKQGSGAICFQTAGLSTTSQIRLAVQTGAYRSSSVQPRLIKNSTSPSTKMETAA